MNVFINIFLICFGEEKTNMLMVLVLVQALVLVMVCVLLFRGSSRGQVGEPVIDPRQAALPDQVLALGTRYEALESNLRTGFAELRRELATEAMIAREAQNKAGMDLRGELARSVAELAGTLQGGLGEFRREQGQASEVLRGAVQGELVGLGQRLSGWMQEAGQSDVQAREALHTRLTELSSRQGEHQERLRTTVEQGLDKQRVTVGESLDRLGRENAEKLEQMRQTVDEKLQSTLQTRLTESFGQVTTHLGEVQKGLGEMKELATGVGDLKKVLGNVKARGVVGEFQLGLQLEQMFSPEQYAKNVVIKKGSQERVEFALKFPNGKPGEGDGLLLPIDSKFPREDWERLEHAYEHGSVEEIASAGKSFERAIRAEGKRICEKYIDPPTTMPHAIMFLPTEGLYAEVVRRPGLLSDVQQQCRVTIAGPSTFMAILTSFQMGFHTLAIEKKGVEVWQVLSRTKNEFEKFGGLMDKVEKQVGTVQNTLKEISGKTTTINRTLKGVGSLDSLGAPEALPFEEGLRLVAAGDE